MKLLSLFLIALVSFAQSPAEMFEKAPPEIDQALRDRVKGFYQLHIEGKWRQAEKFVAEESQDIFYQMQKSRYDSCETLKITYRENFTQAVVAVACKGKWNIQGQEMSVQMPMSSTWKQAHGVWLWHHDPAQKVETPLGTMNYAAGAKTETPGQAMPKDMMRAAQAILSQVSVNKNEAQLSSYEVSETTIEVSNNMKGEIQLRADADGAPVGYTMKFDKTTVPAGSKAVLTLRMEPKDRVAKPTTTVRIFVEPTGQMLPIQLTFAIPPEVEKLLPKAK
jgi:hypothetical protein